MAKPESDEEKVGRWYFLESDDKKSYDFKWGAVGAKGGFVAKARLVRLGNVMFIDFEGDDSKVKDEEQKDNLTIYPAISTHMMGRIWLTDKALEIHFLKDDWVKAQMKAGTFGLAGLNVEGVPLLTAKTEDLQKFMQEYAEDQEALSENFSLVREK